MVIEALIDQRRRDLGGFEVGRILPSAKRRMVGPFVFYDHMGPSDFLAGLPRTFDVRPHPHIGLSTVTYLFEGEIMHRDSVGSEQPIRPGEVNWMTAGRDLPYPERAAYVVSGSIEVDHQVISERHMIFFSTGASVAMTAIEPAVVMLLGGEPIGERFIEWNFVSSSRARIEQAKADWRAGKMKLPDLDNSEFIPLPSEPAPPPNPMS